MLNGWRSTVNEQTALLSNRDANSGRQRTPLPKLQLAVVLLIQSCEVVARSSISPYINQLIWDLGITGGNKAKVGYYAGLLDSLFYVAEASTVLQWGRVSDRIGRKPVLLIGLMGTILSMLCFGLSRTFTALVLSRCLHGVLNGNVGVSKSAIGEVLDLTNRAEGFAFLPAVWPFGLSVASVVGGGLARPYERFPEYFKNDFWREYPYFLSCLGAAIIVFIAFLVALFSFQETLPKHRVPFYSASLSTLSPSEERSEPMPLRKLLTFPVVLSISNHITLALMDMMFISLLPLFMAMPVELGGLGFTPLAIGYVLGILGVWRGLFAILFLARLIRKFGERQAFIVGMLAFNVNFIMLPLINIAARRTGVTWVVWCFLTFSLSLTPMIDMCWGCIIIFITASSPNKHSLGATNGISETTGSIARVIGPTLATSLFSFSVDRNILGGYGVYLILFSLSCAALLPAVHLPVKPWDETNDQLQSSSL
ncbi:hypothetical protein AX14_008958 [Amanita brunnescens Koide BX004]|nr:hypothetical protein AX14_008958 [Amanita brunnescens Koide BX004]